MANIELQELEKLNEVNIDDILKCTGIARQTYLSYRDRGEDISDEDSKKLSKFFKVPQSFFQRVPTMVHYSKDNSFGPIFSNTNNFYGKKGDEPNP